MAEFIGPGANVAGIETIVKNLEALEGRFLEATVKAAEEIAHFLANDAKVNHGDTPRAAGWVYPGGGIKRRWRPAGKGYGDVTGHTTQSISGDVVEITREYVMLALSAGMDYDVFLEKARQGKWAFLWPAVTRNRDVIEGIWARHLEGVMNG